MRTGDLKAAVKSATTAEKTKHTHAPNRAESLFRLSEAQFRTRQGEVAIETAQKAMPSFKNWAISQVLGTRIGRWQAPSIKFTPKTLAVPPKLRWNYVER